MGYACAVLPTGKALSRFSTMCRWNVVEMDCLPSKRRLLSSGVFFAKYQGDYERAQALITQTKHYAQRAQDDDLLHEAIYREASILIEQGNGAEAELRLAILPELPRGLVLQSEAQLILGNHERLSHPRGARPKIE